MNENWGDPEAQESDSWPSASEPKDGTNWCGYDIDSLIGEDVAGDYQTIGVSTSIRNESTGCWVDLEFSRAFVLDADGFWTAPVDGSWTDPMLADHEVELCQRERND